MTTIGSLFSGYGGLDLGVQQAIGGDVIWHSDIKPAAVKLLAYRHPDVSNLGDIIAVDWDSVERPDVLTGGFPCTDISAAGKQAGLIRYGDGKTRSGLWAEMCRAINTLRPELVVAENVRAITSVKADSDVEPCPWCLGDGSTPDMRALGAVLADLADIGYDAAWCGLRAADIGAPHGRFRIFITAWPTDPDAASVGRRPEGRNHGVRAEGLVAHPAADPVGGGRDGRAHDPIRFPVERTAAPGGGGESAADTAGVGRGEGWSEPAGLVGGPDAALGGHAAPDAGSESRIQRWLPAPRQETRRQPLGQPSGRSGTPAANADDVGHCRTCTCGQPTELAATPGGRGPVGTTHEQVGVGPGHIREDLPTTAWGIYEPAIRRWERAMGRVAPSPTEASARGNQRLSPRFVEWMMNLPDGHVTDVPGLSRNDKLSLLGDGVVPAQAAEALRRLLPVITTARAA